MLTLILAGLVPLMSGVKVDAGKSTMYHPRDGYCSNTKADGSKFKVDDHHIAHRSIPLRTKGILCNERTTLCVATVVRDRGPFGAIKKCDGNFPKPHVFNGKTFYAKKIKWKKTCHYWQGQPGYLQKGFRYRGRFDMSRSVAEAIKHRAFDRVTFTYYKK